MMKVTIAAMLTALAVAPALAKPPPEAAASSAGLVTKMSIGDLKAVYDGAGVAYEVRVLDDGREFLSAEPEGYRMYAILTTCPDPSKAVDCTVLLLESGTWDRKLTAEQLAYFNSSPFLGKAFFNEGKPAISYAFVLEPGVSPEYVRTSLRHFLNLMKYFGGFEWLPADAAAPAQKPGSFSVPMGTKSAPPQNDVKPTSN
ncbi:MAG: YbjN domain-containing protein [Micropepsaceae bacterium]